MKYWTITDTHLHHHKLFEWGRPENFEERILSGLKHFVNGNDVVIHLGDVCIGMDVLAHKNLFKAIPSGARKWLVKGNHDRKSDKFYLEQGWDFVSNGIFLDKYGVKMLFTHIPQPKSFAYDVNVHGHLHNTDFRRTDPEVAKIYNEEYHHLVAMEYSNYQPVNLEKLAMGWRKKYGKR